MPAASTVATSSSAAGGIAIESDSNLSLVDADLPFESWKIAAIAAGAAALLLIAVVGALLLLRLRRRRSAVAATPTATPQTRRLSGAWDADMSSARADDAVQQNDSAAEPPSDYYGVMPHMTAHYDVSNLETVGH